jgi:hypothetical protein
MVMTPILRGLPPWPPISTQLDYAPQLSIASTRANVTAATRRAMGRCSGAHRFFYAGSALLTGVVVAISISDGFEQAQIVPNDHNPNQARQPTAARVARS